MSLVQMHDAPLRPTSTMLQNIHLAPRRLHWNFPCLPAAPVANNPELSAFLLAVSWFVVAFEDVGIPVVRNAVPKLAEHPALAREAQVFVAQEALHSQAHELFNRSLVAQHGYDTTAVEREGKRFIDTVLHSSEQEQVAMVAVLEHVIFSVAEWYETAHDLHPQVDPAFHRLLLWHCMEETEHTAVVHDMYEHIYGTGAAAYRMRISTLGRGMRSAVRTLMRMWRALLPQVCVRLGCTPTKARAWASFVRESAPYLGDMLTIFKPAFSPWARSLEPGLLPELRQKLQLPDAGQWQELVVERIVQVSADVRMYALLASNGGALAPWEAGAHVDVEIDGGVVRQYSLCGNPLEQDIYSIAVRQDAVGRGGSLRLHAEVQVGSRLRVGLPRNNFALDLQADGEVVLLAGGIGVTPLLSMAWALHASGQPFSLHLCGRDAEHLPFAGELASWPFADRVHTHLSSQAGRVDLRQLLAGWDAQRPRQLYVCGPTGFMDQADAAARASGWPATAVHLERFAAAAAGPQPGDHAFTLHLARSGRSLQVDAGQSMLEAMEVAGLNPPSACREGLCGACLCSVLEGEVEHRDAILSAEEQQTGKRIATCVSRARGEQLSIDF
ncbi:metal-dependent hydrolase [Pseudomonas sp. N040]|uniref:metal-dependent hydrolase n=1 Tax=Pseudomonas sp. N040 TaxID=2785325 RepID=UPI0018A2BBE0|nr:metal-dependent hydrolase [Pseudomonas sp. N040]MBF7731418.1 metal-dependent hydrolase [Pseudomonas sp. N040]MBW7015062.1 metal-dependent hydrolase [Pseudomonas sp. N040]